MLSGTGSSALAVALSAALLVPLASQPLGALATGPPARYTQQGANAQQDSSVNIPIDKEDIGVTMSFATAGPAPIQGGAAIGPSARDDPYTAYFGTLQDKIYAVDVPSPGYGVSEALGMYAKTKWANSVGGINSGVTPTLTDDGSALFFGSQAGQFHGVDAMTGEPLPYFNKGAPLHVSGPVSTSATLSNGMLFFGNEEFDFYGVNASTGQVAFTCRARGPIVSAPAVSSDGQSIYLTSMDTYAYKMTLSTAMAQCGTTPGGSNCFAFGGGCADWGTDVSTTALSTSPALDDTNGLLYVTSEANGATPAGLYKVDVSGAQPTVTRLNSCNDTIPVAPVVPAFGYDMVIGVCDDTIYADSVKDGSRLWSYQAGGQILSTPISNYDVVAFGASDDKVYFLNITSGQVYGAADVGGVVAGQPAVNQRGQVCVGTDGGSFVCVGTKTFDVNVLRVVMGVAVIAFLVFLGVCVVSCGKTAAPAGAAGDGYSALDGGEGGDEEKSIGTAAAAGGYGTTAGDAARA